MLKIRADSRGQPVRRTFLGNTDSFYEAMKLRNSKQEMIKKAAMPRHSKLPQIGPLAANFGSALQVDAFMGRNVELDKINSASTFRADPYGSNFQSIGATPKNFTLNSKAKNLIESRKRNLSVGFSTMNDIKNESFNKRLPSEIYEEESLT